MRLHCFCNYLPNCRPLADDIKYFIRGGRPKKKGGNAEVEAEREGSRDRISDVISHVTRRDVTPYMACCNGKTIENAAGSSLVDCTSWCGNATAAVVNCVLAKLTGREILYLKIL